MGRYKLVCSRCDFSCLPHGIFMKYFQSYQLKIIIDLSADFRLSSAKDYVEWYNFEHKSVETINHFVYGLTELNRSNIRKSEKVACPGCYPTATLLALYPLIADDLIDIHNITIDAKSGISGAGGAQKETYYLVRFLSLLGHILLLDIGTLSRLSNN